MAGSTLIATAGAYFLLKEKGLYSRENMNTRMPRSISFKPNEEGILRLASMAASGHNAQPWFVKYIEPYQWIICNDKSRWLPAVDPTQRETILSIGAFIQNIEYGANNLGYLCKFDVLAVGNQDENIVSVTLLKTNRTQNSDIQKIRKRRIVRSNYLNDPLKKGDLSYLLDEEADFIHSFPNTSPEHGRLNEQTIEANRIQAHRDEAERELANWIRFSRKDAEQHADGLTVSTMEIEGLTAWILRNFYSKEDVMKKSFREKSIETAIRQVSTSAGWLVITSKDNSVASLLETGKRFQRLALKVRERNIAIHPMTQILEEPVMNKAVNQSIGIHDPIQFILRTGYLKTYPDPVSLRRQVESFVQI